MSGTQPPAIKGARIKFLKTITEGPTGDHPIFHLCTRGDLGTIEEDYIHLQGRMFDCLVYWDGFPKNAFFIRRDEFEVLDG